MARKRRKTVEPIGPTNLPGEELDPKIPDELAPPVNEGDDDDEKRRRRESDEEQAARDSEKAFDRAVTRIPPD